MRGKVSTAAVMILLFLINVKVTAVERTVGVIQNKAGVYEGYTLFSPMDSGDTYLIDNYGRIINKWHSQYRPNLSVYLTEEGNIVKSIKSSDERYGVEIMNWEGEVIWEYFYTGTLYLQHHDIEPMPNGNILMVVRDIRLKTEMVEAGRDPASMSTARIWLEKIVEVQPSGLNTGVIVWEWEVYDHLVQDFDPAADNYGVISEHPELINVNYTPNALREWLHMNSVDYNEELDQIVMSVRNLNELWVIDHSTTLLEASGHTGGNSGKGGDILYRWGNPKAYNATGNTQKFYNQHDARWIETGFPGEGNFTVFNNGELRPDGAYSTVDEISPSVDTNGNYNSPVLGNSYGPVNLEWSYVADPPESMYSMHISGAHRLKNGNTIMCQGYDSHFYEVNYDKEILWEYISPVKTTGGVSSQGDIPTSSSVFRNHKYSKDYPAFLGKDLTPEGYIEINPISFESTIHSPLKPTELVYVTITSKIFDENGITSADLYVYAGTDSLIIPMYDDGTGADLVSKDSIYTAVVPIFNGVTKVNYYIKALTGSKEEFTDPPFASRDYTFSYNVISVKPLVADIKKENGEVTIIWNPIQYATSYKVYSSDLPYSGFKENTNGVFDGTSWSIPSDKSKQFYYVKAFSINPHISNSER